MIEVGGIYDVMHSRKGRFVMKIESIGDEFVSGVVTNGEAGAAMMYNRKFEGDNITVRKSFCTFSPINPPAEEK